MFRCIYCGARSEQAFPSEHVLPKMFGQFAQNATLHCVCGRCNNLFSKLELSFGRDSPEAMERLRHGLKPVNEASQVGRVRAREMVVDVPGVHHGARVQLSNNDGTLSIKPVPQVGFRLGEEQPIWFDEADLTADAVAPYRDGHVRIVRGPTDDDLSRLVSRLESLGMTIRDPRPLEPPGVEGEEIDTVLTYTVDDTVQRVVAKIAFNYVAWVTNCEFVLQADFNAIRAFIRHGVSPPWEAVRPVAEPLLSDETPEYRRAQLHLLTARWNRHTGALLGQVSFFNIFNYWVALCDGFSGIWMPIHSGHCFSLVSRDIRPLASDEKSSSG